MPSRPRAAPQPPTLGSTMTSITSSASGSIWDAGAVAPAVRAAIRKVTAWPQTTSADASAMPSHALRGEEPVADVAGRCAADPRPRRPTATGSRPSHEHDARTSPPRPRSPPAALTSARATAARGERPRSGGPARPARRSVPSDGPQRAADIAHVATVADPAVHVAHDPAGQRDVEEQRSVVRRHRRRQRQVDAEATGHDLPPPSTAHRGQHRQARRCRQRPAVDRADAIEERARAQAARPGWLTSRRSPRSGPTSTRSGSCRRPLCLRVRRTAPNPDLHLHSRRATGTPVASRTCSGSDHGTRSSARLALAGRGRKPPFQPHPAIRFSTAGSWAMTEIGTS